MKLVARGDVILINGEMKFILTSSGYNKGTGQVVCVPVVISDGSALHEIDVSIYLGGTRAVNVSRLDTINIEGGYEAIASLPSNVLLAVQSRVFSLLGYEDFSKQV